jgi:hypothetical protein
MATINAQPPVSPEHSRTNTILLLAIAGIVVLLHLVTNSRYGFHRDELQFLSDARHLDWGFVAYPPLTAFVEHISLSLFGLSLVGLRLFSVLAQATAIVVTGLMARELGGGRLAQATAALAVAFAPLSLFEGTEFQYTTFEYLWWVLTAYFTIRILKSENPRWWLAIGVSLGLGLETKYAVCFFIAGLLAGLALTRSRRYVLTAWFWAGVAIALLIFLPNFLWLVHHDFISYRFLQHIHTRDVGEGRAEGFWRGQFIICANVFTTPLWIAGLVAFLRSPRYRMLAWMYLVPVAMFYLGKGRGYYTASAYPVLLAMGAAVGERWLATLPRLWANIVRSVYFTGFAAASLLFCAILIPLAPSGPLRDFALKNNGDLREEFGWNELVHTVAGIRDTLPPDQQQSLGILVGNYGEQGAVEILGPALNLPPPISGTNSAWLRSYPTQLPSTLIVIGFSREEADKHFTSCHLAGHNGNSQGISNEETEYHPDIFLCGPPIQPWPDFWKTFQRFG